MAPVTRSKKESKDATNGNPKTSPKTKDSPKIKGDPATKGNPKSKSNPTTKSNTRPLAKSNGVTLRTEPVKSLNKPGKPLVDFHDFASLPNEMQDEVWAIACDEAITIQVVVGDQTVEFVGAIPFKVPAVLQATSGSRSVALKHFQPLEVSKFNRGVPSALGHQGQLPGLVATLFGGFSQGITGPVVTTGVPGGIAMVNGNPQGVNINNLANGFNGLNLGINGTIAAPQVTAADSVVLSDVFPFMSGCIVRDASPLSLTYPFLAAARGQQRTIHTPAPRKFYINVASTSFKLQFGELSQYSYPTFSLAQDALDTSSKYLLTTEARDARVNSLEQAYSAPQGFPTAGKVPEFFKDIRTLVLNISLPPCKDGRKFSCWAEKSAETLMSSLFVQTTLQHFPALRTLDFYVPSDHKINPKKAVVLQHFRNVYISNTDGITLNFPQMALLEEYIQGYIIQKGIRGGNNAPLASRLVVW